jgi:tryptophan synthase beta chain
MRLLGGEVRGVDSGSRTLKDAINEAMRDWVTNVRTTHYLLGSVLGAHPYPMMVRDFHSVIGIEARAQILEKTGGLPDLLVACVGGGSNAMGLFHCVPGRPGGDGGRRGWGRVVGGRAACGALSCPRPGGPPPRSAGSASFTERGPTSCRTPPATSFRRTRSRRGSTIRPSVPSTRCSTIRVACSYASVSDAEALDAFGLLALSEGVIPALESAHAVAWVVREAAQLRDKLILVNLSGRGDKDLGILGEQGGAASHPPEPPAFASRE